MTLLKATKPDISIYPRADQYNRQWKTTFISQTNNTNHANDCLRTVIPNAKQEMNLYADKYEYDKYVNTIIVLSIV